MDAGTLQRPCPTWVSTSGSAKEPAGSHIHEHICKGAGAANINSVMSSSAKIGLGMGDVATGEEGFSEEIGMRDVGCI